MRTISVGTVSISITNIIVAFINICEHNRFAMGNWIEKKTLQPVCRITRQLLVMNSYSTFFLKYNLILPWHDSPFPVYPSLQVQLWEPLVFVQFAFTSQSWLPISMGNCLYAKLLVLNSVGYSYSPWHDCPSPVYPSLQVQIWEPSVLLQFELTWQTWLPLLHSLTSENKNELPKRYSKETNISF